MPGNNTEWCAGHEAKPFAGINIHQFAGKGTDQSFDDVDNNTCVADSDAHRAGQRNPAKDMPAFAKPFVAGSPCHAVGTNGTGGGTTTDCEFGSQCNIAEQDHENQISDDESTAAVLADFGGEAPHVGHADRRAN